MAVLKSTVQCCLQAILLIHTATTLLIHTTTVTSLPADVLVKVEQGQLQGNVMLSRGQIPFYAFRGIPYAKPPIGELRFKAPQLPEPWDGIYYALNDRSECVQKNYLLAGSVVQGQEDCLFLNVYTHNINDPYVRKPVMVYIHGGGWFTGSGSSVENGPEYFMDEDVVLVTINYRLGALGFLSTEDDAASGNWALKDQNAALQWVQRNIAQFGGDPNTVTIFGQSAGSASVHYHILSEQSKGLFHRAITQSGSTLNLWARPLVDAKAIARLQAGFVGCPSDVDTNKLIECLRTVDAYNLTQTGDNFKFWSVDPLTVFVPVVETKTQKNNEPFITADPLDLLRNGKIANRVPWMVGVVPQEGVIRAGPIITNDTEREDLNSRFDELGPMLLAISLSDTNNEPKALWKRMADFYLGPQHVINEDTNVGFVDLYSDRSFIYGVYQSALLHAQAGHKPIYFYHMEYRGFYSWSKIFANSDRYFGVSHCDDLIYLFRSPLLFPDLPPDYEDTDVSRKLVSLWTQFAKTGDPNPPNNVIWFPLPDIEGRKGTNSDLHYLNIARAPTSLCGNDEILELEMKTNFYQNRMEFMESLPLAENLNLTSRN